jgi:uncharacterized protein
VTRAEPERTCVGCRERAAKHALLRVVRGVDDVVSLDSSGAARGRGAYVHREPACVEAALRRGALARALRTGLGTDEVVRLKGDIERQLTTT